MTQLWLIVKIMRFYTLLKFAYTIVWAKIFKKDLDY
jgi:hypothetical protein